MRHKRSIAGKVPDETEVPDARERFVLHGGADDLAAAVPDEAELRIDIEETLRHLDDPERRRVRARRTMEF